MKRIIVFVVSVAFCTIAMAQQLTHVVQRGETLELIARRYNISQAQLKASNPNVDQCYVGMKLNIPQGAKHTINLVTNTPMDIQRINEASGYLKRGKYRKATSIYTQVIKDNPSSTSYYGRGLSYYNRAKYKSAISDFEMAISSKDCTDEIESQCRKLIKNAEKLREEQHARRSERWGGFAAAVVGVAATAYIASEQSKMQNQYNQTSIPSSSVSGSSHLSRADQIIAQSNANLNQMSVQRNAQLNMMTQNAIVQAEQSKQRISEATFEEYKWRGEYEKEKGYPPTEMEVIQWYQSHYPDLTDNYIQALGKRYEDSHPEKKNYKERLEEKKKEREEKDNYYKSKFETKYSSGKDCTFCYGTGNCQTCNGKGWYNNPLDLRKTVACPNCDRDHNGKCSHCHGTRKNP